jgi:hypothetical protein
MLLVISKTLNPHRLARIQHSTPVSPGGFERDAS